MYHIGTIAGGAPGAGEAVDIALDVVGALGIEVARTEFDLGAQRYLRTGELLPPAEVDRLRGLDALFCGSPPSGDTPGIAPGVLERGIVFGLRRELGLAVNLRVFRGIGDLDGVDVAVVRENSEGAYSAEGSVLHRDTENEIATEVSVATYRATEHCARYAFELARRRDRRLTLAHKSRVLVASGGLWERVVHTLAGQYPDVRLNVENVDTLCARLVAEPARYDVIVTENVFGDIVSDVACAATRSASYSSSAELTSRQSGPSLFEPVHGPQDVAADEARHTNPLAAINAAAMMLRELGERVVGEALWRATPTVVAERPGRAGLVERVVAATRDVQKEMA